MFQTQSRDLSFDFNISLEEKESQTAVFECQDDFPDDVLVKTDKITCYSSRGAHKHNYDQFDLVVQNSFTLAAVYDGHGGPTVSLYLKENLLKNIVKHGKFETEPAQSLIQCISRIEEEVTQLFEPTCGSTLLVVLWRQAGIMVASVGDTLCYGFKYDEADCLQSAGTEPFLQARSYRKFLLNDIHNLENEQERGRVRGEGGAIFKRRNSYRVSGELCLSRSIGDSKYKKWISAIPSIKEYSQSFTHVVLASDGFSKALEQINQPQNISDFVWSLPFLRDNSTFLLLERPQVFCQVPI